MITDTLDTLDENDMLGDSEAEEEVDAILSEITGNKLDAGHVPEGITGEKTGKQAVSNGKTPIAVGGDSDDEEMLNSMRERLKALQS